MLLQCPPHPPILPTHTHPTQHALAPPLTPNTQNVPMGARFGCSASSLPTLHIPSSFGPHEHEKRVPRDAFFVFVAPITPPSAAEHQERAHKGAFLVFNVRKG